MPHRRHRLAGFASAALLLVAGPVVPGAAGQGSQATSPAPVDAQPAPAPDFLLGRPHGSFGLRGNWLMARAGSDIYDFVTEQLTLNKSAFNGPTIGGELAITLSPRAEIVGGVEVSKSVSNSEYRKYIDNRGLPIQQTTELKIVNVTAGAKVSLLPRGRHISRYAWIPRTLTPYVGAGAGATYHAFAQSGDFVDYQDLHVFTDTFTSGGWGANAHAFGGVDVQVYRRLFVSFEGRYVWSAAKLGRDFIGFAPMDLSGVRFGGGVHLAF